MGAIKSFNDWFFLSKMIFELQESLNQSAANNQKREIWLELSEKALFYCNRNFIGTEVSFSEPALHIIRYLRCSLFWMTQDWDNFEKEIDIALKENYSPIFFIIRAFYSLYFLVDKNMFSLDKSLNPSMFKMLRYKNSFIKEAEMYFNKALSEINKQKEPHLRSSILWGKSWILFKLKKEVDMAEYVNKAWNADGNNIGEGWQLWAQWMGRFIDPIDNLILLDHIKK